MKYIIKPFFLITLWTSLGNAAEVPKDYAMDCWDGTFMYNELAIQSNADQLIFRSSSQSVGIYSNLLSVGETWGIASATFSVPKKNCVLSAEDPKILSCESDALMIEVEGELGSKPPTHQMIEKKNVTIQIRKVQFRSPFIDTTTGYELTLSHDWIGPSTTPIFTQNYFYGLDKDESDRCKITTK